AAILQHTQPSAAGRVEKLLQLQCAGESRSTAWTKPLAPVANTLKSESIESMAKAADNKIKIAEPSQIEEIPHTSHLTSTRSGPIAVREERMQRLEAEIDALILQRNQLRSRPIRTRSKNHKTRK
ncbi:hypothetical protein ACTXT7_017483, partial [Hymenolepis weldensis]